MPPNGEELVLLACEAGLAQPGESLSWGVTLDPRVQKDREEKGLSNKKQQIDQDCGCAQRDSAIIKRTIVEFVAGKLQDG